MISAGEPPERARAVHQFVPALIPRDATGSHTLLLRQVLRRAGWRSEIFAEATHEELASESIPVTDYARRAGPDDVLVYQFSTSSSVAELLCERSEPLIIDYHNVTGPEHYEGWDDVTARRAAAAQEQLAMLSGRTALALADSSYNEIGLRAAGYRQTAVVPVLVDLERLVAAPDPRVAARLASAKSGGGADWLFVGRLVPSKAQHELVKALWAYRRLFDPHARLHLVGSAPSGRYLRALRSFIGDLGLNEAVRISGEVSDAALAAHFEAADVYVSLSVHEGFGVPLLESMRVGLPIVALGEAAVADTVGSAGLVLDHAEPSRVAAAVHRVLSDPVLRARLTAAGIHRTDALSMDRAAAAAVSAIATVAGDPPGRRAMVEVAG